MEVVKEHVESHRLLELAQMAACIDQPEWSHISGCQECGATFLMLQVVIVRSSPTRLHGKRNGDVPRRIAGD